MKALLDLPDPFDVEVWSDPFMDPAGIDATGPYPEEFWLPILGPTSYVLARRLLREPGEWAKTELAIAVGVTWKGGRNCVLERSLARLEGYRLATVSDGKLYIRHRWPRVGERLLGRLPAFLREQEPSMHASVTANTT